jgi:hypothetical protein
MELFLKTYLNIFNSVKTDRMGKKEWKLFIITVLEKSGPQLFSFDTKKT